MLAIILATIGGLAALDIATFFLEVLFGTIIGAAVSRIITIIVIVLVFRKCMK